MSNAVHNAKFCTQSAETAAVQGFEKLLMTRDCGMIEP